MWGEPLADTGAGPPETFQLPVGTVTFLLSDIEGSTRLWELAPDAMGRAVSATYEILDEAIARHGGVRPVEQGEGDSVVAAFSRAADAVAAALDAQRALHAQRWPDDLDLRVRIALHTADAQLRDEGTYFGVALSRCARLRGIASGGQTLLSRSTRDLVVDRLPDRAGLIDCGVHRLRDLGRPEHVYALAHPELGDDIPRLRSLDGFPNNLPDRLTSFVGRARELEEVCRALAQTRLLTLTGAGGAGKTRLALQAAADALERFPDGAWWVELAPLGDERLLGEALAAAVGVRPLAGLTPLQAVCAHLAPRCALVVLDNCEHLLPASAEAAQTLLESCPQVAVLATSRTPLGVPGETDWRVPSLSLPAGEPRREPVAALAQCDAVRLFIERARKARANFEVTTDNAPAVAQICHELDGLPLAIELAAARVRMLTVGQIAAALGDRFRLLTGGARTVLPRHQTLRASVDWSHDLLSEPERMLLRRLSVFAGGFTLDACEHVGAGDGLETMQILDLLASLVDKSLVLAEERGPVARYRLLETVRQYALERLREAGEEGAVRDRHRDAFLMLAERAAPGLRGRGQRHWLGVLDPEAANLAAAIDRAADTDPERALRFCVALTVWWRVRGLFAAAEQAFASALGSADAAPSTLRALALWGRAWILTIAGRYEASVRFAQEALAMAEQVGDPAALGRAHNELGLIQLFTDPVGSRERFRRARELSSSCDDHLSHAYAIINLAFSHLNCEEVEVAEQLFAEALPAAERLDYGELVAWYWIGMARVALLRADGAQLREAADRALAAGRSVEEPVTQGFAHVLLGWWELQTGRAADAVARLEASRELLVTQGSGMPLPWTDSVLAAAQASTGAFDAARARLDAVIATGADYGGMLAFAMLQLADVLRVGGEAGPAKQHVTEAMPIAQRVQSAALTAWAREILGRLAAEAGDWQRSEALLHEALTLRVERGLRLYLPQTLDALAEVAAGLESHAEAARILGAANRARADLRLARWRPDELRMVRLEEALRRQLGDADFASAYTEGAALELDEALKWMRRSRGHRRRPTRGWESLTPTELEVVQLVAEGLTNPQIGARMFISRGTVKTHLSHVFAKLGIDTRAELAALATRRGVTTSS